MPYVDELMETGEFQIQLSASTPRSVLDEIDIRDYAFALVAVTSHEVNADDFSSGFFDTPGPVRYVGLLLEQSTDRRVLSGENPVWLLGSENDGGDMYVGADTTSAALSLDAQLTARVTDFGNGIAVSVEGPATTATRTIKVPAGTTRRQLLDTIRLLYEGGPYEWRLYPNRGMSVGRRGSLWPTTSHPTVILTRDGGAGSTSGSQKYLSLDGTGDYAEAGDSAALDITGDIDIRVRVRLNDYTSGAIQTLVSKWNTTGNQRAYRFEVTAGGELQIFWSTNGTAALNEASTGASFTDGTDYWLRVTLDVNDGGGNRVTNFYYSADATSSHEDVTWTSIDTNTTAGTTSIFNSTSVARVSGIVGSTLDLAGRVYAAAILDGIDGTVVADPDFTEWDPGESSRSDDAGTTWTLNGNAAIVGEVASTVTGVPCTFNVSTVDVRDYRTDITAGDPNTLIVGSATNTPPAGWINADGTAPPVLTSFVSSSPRKDFQDHPRRWSATVGGNKYAAWVLNSAAQATTKAEGIAASVNSYAVEIDAEADIPDIGRHIVAGDTVYVYDPDLALTDTANEVYYRGEATHPAKHRVQRMTVPISPGMGVYVVRFDDLVTYPAGRFINLSRYVELEEEPARLEIGAKARFHPPNTIRTPIDRRALARKARLHYALGRLTFSN